MTRAPQIKLLFAFACWTFQMETVFLLSSVQRVTSDFGVSQTSRAFRNRPSKFIIGGKNVNSRSAWPWQARIQYRSKETGDFNLCGGTLISERHIMTAAHCTSDIQADPNNIVMMGLVSMHQQDAYKQDFQFAKVTTHPDYGRPNKFHADIGIIEVKTARVSNDQSSTAQTNALIERQR
ncbi:hypothetical protein L596_004449 [Steinernema carpocapsae]|uniref:Peptidase S1 domain-containing protein n=1 Tax=Steinernema carpocapsae TaxID=34508 RepID=A0A4U8UZY6_STECR|nr:hypothetical protein L596_004449 [Steinernema carpocapsae]